jgi:hypothetical protein
MRKVLAKTWMVGPLQVVLHRTVRVADGKVNDLPPSLGYMDLYRVQDYRETCPAGWEDEAHFVVLHDQEALWLSFTSNRPVAVVAGAGGVNALTGEPLRPALAQDGYMVVPPQPWLDGWKRDQGGTVYQFVATRYEGGAGATVGEQLLGAESRAGGLGLAVYEAIDPGSLTPVPRPHHGVKGGPQGQHVNSGGVTRCSTAMSFESGPSMMRGFDEMGVGKGGEVTQHIYPDPHGLAVWRAEPTAVQALYLVDAAGFTAITGLEAPPSPVSSTHYQGHYFDVADQHLGDVAGSDKFTGLATVFEEKTDTVPKKGS